MLEDGELIAHGTHDELLESVRPLPRDRREGPARPGLPHPQAARARGGGAVSAAPPATASPGAARRDPRGGCAARAGAGASCAGCCAAAALPLARGRDVRGADLRHRRVAGPRPAGQARDRRRDRAGRPRHAEPDRRAVRRLGADRLARRRSCRPTSTGWVGQRALQDLRLQIFRHLQDDAGRLLRAPARGRADLAHDQRRRGAGLAGHRQRRSRCSRRR